MDLHKSKSKHLDLYKYKKTQSPRVGFCSTVTLGLGGDIAQLKAFIALNN